MSLPFRYFLKEANELELAVILIPQAREEACGIILKNRTILIGMGLDLVDIGIIGLHELGHFATVSAQDFAALCDTEDEFYARYVYEIAAWDWAESKMPAGYEKRFQEIKKESLQTYVNTINKRART